MKHIAIAGLGVVGGGVAEILLKNAALLEDFVTQHYGIADVAQAFAFATEHPEKVRKIVVEL